MNSIHSFSIDVLMSKALQKEPLNEAEISYILQLRQPDTLAVLFHTARRLRSLYFGNRIFLYGFLYISTYCRNQCSFCLYRVSNELSPRFRYRKEAAEIVQAAEQLGHSGVHLIDLTMGEDPLFFQESPQGMPFELLIELIKSIKATVSLPIMVSPGVVSPVVLRQFTDLSVDWYACYQETHNLALFQRLRPNQDYSSRLQCKQQARQMGLLVEEGILVGAGETTSDIIHSLHQMRMLNAAQVRAMNFVPQPGTPMAHFPFPDPVLELIMIALLRILFPDRLIPATLDVEGLAGLKSRLDAGANVVTSIVPPQQGLAGVAQSCLDIENARRTTDHVLPVLAECGLQAATTTQYQEWLNHYRHAHREDKL